MWGSATIVVLVKPVLVVIGLLLAGDHVKVGGLEIHGLVYADTQVLWMPLSWVDWLRWVLGVRTLWGWSDLRCYRMCQEPVNSFAGWHMNELRDHNWLATSRVAKVW
jgi:hypothetical protein